MSTIAKALQPLRAVTWYIGELMGDHDYQKYCEHQRLYHPDQEILTEREYWRQRHAAAEANPQTRCC